MAPEQMTADEVGQHVARAVFAKRGNNSEIHLTEASFANAIAAAVEMDRERKFVK